MMKPENILPLLDEIAAAKKRAASLKGHPDLTLAEQLEVWGGVDQAAANRFDVVAQAYRELVAAPASSAVLALFKAAWEMSVEQQAGPEGWSMAKRWAFDNLRAALEPFRTEAGDELDYSKISCPAAPAAPAIEKTPGSPPTS